MAYGKQSGDGGGHAGMPRMSEACSETTVQADAVSEPDVELLLASTNAIQRLITERNELRSRVTSLESELSVLRQQAPLIHDGYRRLADEFVTQFKRMDSAVSNLLRRPAYQVAAEHSLERQSESRPDSEGSSVAA
jgi:hypothetical protein